ncbi:MAG: response regulator transcription factor [Deltaproteobacteria bacterium]|nr:response regulator transcription factor [Deltaproteobacteria bacterium]
MAVVAGSLAGVVYLWRSTVRRYKRQHSELSSKLVEVNRDLEHWREQSRQFTVGLSESIEKQLKNWGLTEAESDVAFLLIKGLSLKEIAEVRETSERTVRQQAAAIYAKSNLAGRAQLAAFFLEDLFDTRTRKG